MTVATTPSITISDALADHKLLGSALGDVATWSTWMAVFGAAFGLKLNRAERRAFESVAGSRQPPSKRVDELWAIAGRGSGKSRISAAIAVYIACFMQHTLAAGEIGYVLVLAGSRDQAQMVFSYAQAFIRKSAILRRMIKSVTAYEIKLTNNVVIAVHTNSFRLIRGKTLLACIFDEVSTWRDDTSANPDLEVFRAVRPSLARTGGMLVGISTPYRKNGLLYAKYLEHYDTDSDDVLVVKGGTELFNPTISATTIAKELAADPEGARSEWAAEFRSDISALFDDAVIEDAIDYARPLELPPRGNRRYHCFTDAGAGRRDAFCACVGHCEGEKGEERWLCDVVRGRLAPFDPRSVAEEFARLARSYGCTKIVGDAYAGEWVAQAFRDCGVKYETSPLNKSALYLEVVPSFNQGVVSIPNHERLLRELRGLERRVHRSGKDSVDHPSHGSDDHANVVCGALYMALHELRKPKMRWGTCGYGGKVHWKDSEPKERPRIRFVRCDEAGNELSAEQAAAIRHAAIPPRRREA